MFYGTPGKGAEIAEIGRRFSANKQFAEMSNIVNLEASTRRFNNTPWPFNRVCLAEGANMGFLPAINPFAVRVVPEASAAALCNGRASVLAGLNHSAIVKPTAQHIEPHRRLRLQYGDCIRPLLGASSAPLDESPDVINRVADWFNELKLQLRRPPEGKDRITLLRERLWPEQSTFPLPRDLGEPTFSYASYEWLPGLAFAIEAASFAARYQL
jgi:hypothetical protein